ncbi:AAA family ATPase [Sphingomonas sp. XXL09]|uniref:AAA family ATPase n=1 Tax=Sphingomonas sp. XXL09 TaxID=3457787 RepID=UPI00406BB207
MYLKQAVVENSGPLRWLNLNLAFTSSGAPKPLVLVGANGSGKTNLLSLIVDALFEAAASHHDNVLPAKGFGRSWFRIVGGRTLTVGTGGGFSLLRFDDAGTSRFYKEKAGTVDPTVAALRTPTEFSGQLNWPTDGSFKEFAVEDDRSRILFEQNVFAYFPSSRSETPYWLNREAVPETEFEVFPNISKKLRNPIYVEHAIDRFKQWLISVLSDCRTEIKSVHTDQGTVWQFVGDPVSAMQAANVVEVCNKLLRAIMDDQALRFAWLGRKSADKVAIARNNELAFPNLDALSTGQAILLGMFGSIIRYGDQLQTGSDINLSAIKGICVIDEIDAHIHIDLQYRVLPSIIKLFPNIQFIMTSHSPVFVLGMESEFGPEGIQVIDMPNGTPVGAETYTEFGRALEVMAASHSFTERVVSEIKSLSKPIVFVEGETDAPYLRRAATVLGRSELLAACDIEWIGSKDENGQGFHTGKDALKHTLSVLKANPTLSMNKVLLFYDNDTTAPDADFERVHVRRMPTRSDNTRVKAGVENLLPENVFRPEFYQDKETLKPGGESIITRSIRKTDLCDWLVANGSADDFAGFGPALDIIEAFLAIPR